MSSPCRPGPRAHVRPFGADRGSVMVEAALIIPILVFLIFGVIEWSFVLRDEAAVSSAARTGVRTASTPAAKTFSKSRLIRVRTFWARR